MEILRVNMNERSIRREPLAGADVLLGNRGFIGKVLLKEVPPTCHPLGPENKLIIAAGPLAGTPLSSSARLSVGAKSPLTGGAKESNAGGVGGEQLALLGIRAVIVEGQPAPGQQFVLYLAPGKAELHPASDYKGLGNYALRERLDERYGTRTASIAIGPAGEHLLAVAGVFVNDAGGTPSRACGRGGMGAVMGSKGLKAVVVDPQAADRGKTMGIPIARPDEFRAAVRAFHGALRETPQTAVSYPRYGTAGAMATVNALGGLPTRNFSLGRFDDAERIDGDALRQLILDRGGEGKTTHSCMTNCMIRCSNVFPGPDGRAAVSPLEYESLGLLGSNLCIGDLDAIARLNYLCNDIGADVIEVGAALGVAMEAGVLGFGDAGMAAQLIEAIGEATLLGRVLGQGAVTTGRVLGVTRVPSVKGQALAAHEPRAIKGMTVTYSMSPMGGDHTAGVTVRAPVNHHSPQGQMELSRNVQVNIAAYDTLGMCMFVVPAVGQKPQLMVDVLNAAYGLELMPGFIADLGKEVIKRERAFNLAAGLTRAHDRLPDFFRQEKLPPFDLVADILEADLERFWDLEFWGAMPQVGDS